MHPSRKGIINSKNVRGAPDIVIEIVSPTHPERDRKIKHKIYAQRGVREYWVVDPDAQTIEVLKASPAGFDLVRTFSPGVPLFSPLLPDLSIELAKVFA